MTTTLFNFLKYIFAFSMFLSALAYTVFTTTEVNLGYEEIPNTQTVYNVQTEIPKEVYWSGAQVVGKLYRLTEDNVPVTVGGFTFRTDKDVMNRQQIINLNATYKQDVEFNENGEIEHITFTLQ